MDFAQQFRDSELQGWDKSVIAKSLTKHLQALINLPDDVDNKEKAVADCSKYLRELEQELA
jgi:hypothetical protein